MSPRLVQTCLAACVATFVGGDALAHSGSAAATASANGGYFKLQTLTLRDHDRCLEANGLSETSLLAGATFMDRCQFVTGQAWTAKPLGEGRFQLQSQLHAGTRCLAINAGNVGTIPKGALYMAPCETTGPAFEAVSREDASAGGFQLKTRFEGRDVCLASGSVGDAKARAVPVRAAICSAKSDRLWTLANGHLVDGVPVVFTPPAASPADPLAAENETGKPAECLWNDGTGDRPEYYDCRVERLDRNGSFVVKGDDRLHEFVVQLDRPDEAYGFQTIGNDTIRLGRFRRRVEDPACWLNNGSGERLCIW